MPTPPLVGARPYVRHAFDASPRGPAAFYGRGADHALAADVAAVVAAEGPIHRDELDDRVAEAWGLSKVTKRVTARLDVIRQAVGLTATDDFYRSAAPREGFRVPPVGAQRDVDQIAPEEIKTAALAVIDAQGGLPAGDLEVEVARAFGAVRPRERARLRVRRITDEMLAAGTLSTIDGVVRRAL